MRIHEPWTFYDILHHRLSSTALCETEEREGSGVEVEVAKLSDVPDDTAQQFRAFQARFSTYVCTRTWLSKEMEMEAEAGTDAQA